MKTRFFILINILVIVLLTGLGFIMVYYFGVSDSFIVSNNTVVRIIDGDTFELASGNIVRLLCVNSPETNEEGWVEAGNFLSSLILGKEVILESDMQDKDDYGRWLRYVYLNDFSDELIFVNKVMFDDGFAEMMVIPPADSLCGEISGDK